MCDGIETLFLLWLQTEFIACDEIMSRFIQSIKKPHSSDSYQLFSRKHVCSRSNRTRIASHMFICVLFLRVPNTPLAEHGRWFKTQGKSGTDNTSSLCLSVQFKLQFLSLINLECRNGQNVQNKDTSKVGWNFESMSIIALCYFFYSFLLFLRYCRVLNVIQISGVSKMKRCHARKA